MKKISLVISLSFLVLFLLTSNVNSSPNWVKYLNDKDGNICSYKKVNINKDNGNYIVQVWTKIVLSEKRRKEIIQKRIELGISTKGDDKLSEEWGLSEIDCKKKTERILSVTLYDTDGNVLFSRNYDKREWSYVIPDSRGDILLKKVCK
ncbi:MAG: hypothetical protein PHW12_09450 [Smithella sp.]|nr:hypothetical protein [Smithella sp.]